MGGTGKKLMEYQYSRSNSTSISMILNLISCPEFEELLFAICAAPAPYP